MKSFIPNKKRFSNWSLPSKSSYLSLLIGIIGLGLTITFYLLPNNLIRELFLKKSFLITGKIINDHFESAELKLEFDDGSKQLFTLDENNIEESVKYNKSKNVIIEILSANDIGFKVAKLIDDTIKLDNVVLEQKSNPVFYGTNNKRIKDRILNFRKESSKKTKILILPFYELCEYEDEWVDIGYFIKMRLDSYIKSNNICANTHYIPNYQYGDAPDINNLKDFLKYYHITIVIFGNFISDRCSQTDDMFCVNYIARGGNEFDLDKVSNYSDDYEKFNFLEFNSKERQTDLEFVVEFTSFMSMHFWEGLADYKKRKLPCDLSSTYNYFQRRKEHLYNKFHHRHSELLFVEGYILVKEKEYEKVLDLYKNYKLENLSVRNLHILLEVYTKLLWPKDSSKYKNLEKEFLIVCNHILTKGTYKEKENIREILKLLRSD